MVTGIKTSSEIKPGFTNRPKRFAFSLAGTANFFYEFFKMKECDHLFYGSKKMLVGSIIIFSFCKYSFQKSTCLSYCFYFF